MRAPFSWYNQALTSSDSGEGGYVPANKYYLEGLQRICNREGIMLIIDEVQSGFGRCGTYFAIETIAPGLKPDIMIMAKGIANVGARPLTATQAD